MLAVAICHFRCFHVRVSFCRWMISSQVDLLFYVAHSRQDYAKITQTPKDDRDFSV